jgi:hypothetical protein
MNNKLEKKMMILTDIFPYDSPVVPCAPAEKQELEQLPSLMNNKN